ncbi:hypothetical protein [Bdellovibrio sp. HCB2-146]|uniref:hypothetical protein n=1 Tax=Bdellovibrio sp. HCB2-146 TaxID=3394362 RepID=UPI0039BC50A3
MKTILSFLITTLAAANAFAQNSYEVMCRAKAKEIAIQTYSSCVTESRQAKVEEIRAGYQKDLAALKSKYDKELKKLSGKNTATAAPKKESAAAGPVTVKETQAPRPTKGVAKQLPTRSATPEPAPAQSVSEGQKVVAVGPETPQESPEFSSDTALEKEAAALDGDKIEYIEMPTE